MDFTPGTPCTCFTIVENMLSRFSAPMRAMRSKSPAVPMTDSTPVSLRSSLVARSGSELRMRMYALAG